MTYDSSRMSESFDFKSIETKPFEGAQKFKGSQLDLAKVENKHNRNKSAKQKDSIDTNPLISIMTPNVNRETNIFSSKPPPSPIHVVMTVDDNNLGLINLREAGSLESHDSEEQEDIQKELKLLDPIAKKENNKKKQMDKSGSAQALLKKVA